MFCRIFSFVFVFLLIFSLSVSASNYEFINITDVIYVCDGGGKQFTSGFDLAFEKLSPQQVFMYNILVSGGSSNNDVLQGNKLQIKNLLEKWESYVYKGYAYSDDMIVWDSVDTLFEEYNYIFPDSVKIVFSEQFIASVNYWIWVWNQQNGDTVVNPLLHVLSFDAVDWDDMDTVYSFYTDTGGANNMSLHPASCYISSSFDYNDKKANSFSDFWNILTNSLDIDTYLSWLPGAFASVFMNYWFVVLLPLFGVMVTLKILHG